VFEAVGIRPGDDVRDGGLGNIIRNKIKSISIFIYRSSIVKVNSYPYKVEAISASKAWLSIIAFPINDKESREIL